MFLKTAHVFMYTFNVVVSFFLQEAVFKPSVCHNFLKKKK